MNAGDETAPASAPPKPDISEDFRVVQFTSPGSGCSIGFGKGLTTMERKGRSWTSRSRLSCSVRRRSTTARAEGGTTDGELAKGEAR
jgi:hypothetical protein